MRERLDRFMEKLPDGSYKVVGYQKQEGGRIYHSSSKSGKSFKWADILNLKQEDRVFGAGTIPVTVTPNYIPHDRIDQYTGVMLKENGDRDYISNEGIKLFENDLFQYNFKYNSDNPNIAPVRWDTRICAWFVKNHKLSSLLSNDDYSGGFKITGISGVTPDK